MVIETGDVISALSTIVAAGYAVWTYTKGLRHDKKQDTLDAYNRLQEQALDYLYMKKFSEIEQLVRNTQSSEYKEISVRVARIEHFCTGVVQKIYDRKTVYNLAHGFLDMAIKDRIAPILKRKNFDGKEYYENTKKVIKWMNEQEETEDNTK